MKMVQLQNGGIERKVKLERVEIRNAGDVDRQREDLVDEDIGGTGRYYCLGCEQRYKQECGRQDYDHGDYSTLTHLCILESNISKTQCIAAAPERMALRALRSGD